MELTSNAHATIREVAIRMIKNPELKVEVRGYTDYSGSSKYNLELSTMRAARVKEN
jgi:outer membrane protein OmpA-like peptidoglycan-associated protein